MNRWPDFFIVGAARAGTTSLFTYLGNHPDIFMPSIKEPNFFCQVHVDVKQGERPFRPIITEEEDYLKLFDEAASVAVVGEASPFYLYDEDAPGRIKEKNSKAKIIMVLRDPIERAYSHYLLTLRRGYEAKSFHEALREDYNRDLKGIDLNHLYVELGLYYEQVKRYLEIFGAEQVRIYLFDDLASDTYGVAKDACHFLGVPFHDGKFFDPENKYNAYYKSSNPLVKRLLLVRSAYRWASSLVPRRFIPVLINLISDNDSKPPMEPEAREFLASLYRDDIMRLQSLIGRDLKDWQESLRVEVKQ